VGEVVTEPVKGMLINKQTMVNQGIRKVEFEFNKDGSIKSTFVERYPEKCGWTEKMSLDAWKLI